jgi:enoyl-CoA hydratase/carnithine racemase
MRFTTKLLPSRSGNLGIITLNNPEKLHALTLDMCYSFQDVLSQYCKDESLRAILVKSSNNTNNSSQKKPAFCAGGDVKQLYEAGTQPPQSNKDDGRALWHGQGQPGVPTADFFRNEYYVNHMIATMNDRIPQISIWNGVTMGGGVGISIHGRYRVATEHVRKKRDCVGSEHPNIFT